MDIKQIFWILPLLFSGKPEYKVEAVGSGKQYTVDIYNPNFDHVAAQKRGDTTEIIAPDLSTVRVVIK